MSEINYFNSTSVRVRYADTDQMGIVYYGKYPEYLEVGRVEWLRSLGITYKSMEEGGVLLPVTELTIKYHRPAKYDDLLTIKSMVVEEPLIRIKFDFEIYNQNEELLITAATTLVFMDSKNNRPVKCPDYLIEKIRTSSLQPPQ